MKNVINTTSIFKSSDAELLKKAVTAKIEKLVQGGEVSAESRNILPFVH